MITDREIADKRNEVTMLRLQISERKERRRLNEIAQKSLTDADEYAENIITGNLRRINIRMHKQIREHCETIGALGATIHELEERDALKTTAIDELQKTIEEMKSKVEPPNLAVMVLLHNLNAKTEALEADLKASHTNNAALGKALEEANTALYNAKNVVEGLEAELSDSKSAIVMKNGVINDCVGHLERVYNQLHGFQDDVYEKNKTIDELNETISDLRMAASDMLDTINECSRRESEDSRMLMQIVEIIKEDGLRTTAWHQIHHIVEDYLDAPEGPVVTLELPSMGTRVVSKNEETLVVDETKMEAVRMLVGSDMWVLHTDEEAVEDKQQKDTIDELKDFIRHQGGCVDDRDNRIEQLMVLNEALRIDMESAHNLSCDHIAGQDRFIEGLKTETDARNRVIKDFKAIEQKETDRLHETIEGNGKIIDELNDMYCDVCGKLEQIEKVTKDAISYVHIDEITKIIQEE